MPKEETSGTLIQESNEILLKVSNLSVYFAAKKHLFHASEKIFKAVDDLSFDLHKGKTLAVVGESGCGKTTLSRALLSLLPISAGGGFLWRSKCGRP